MTTYQLSRKVLTTTNLSFYKYLITLVHLKGLYYPQVDIKLTSSGYCENAKQVDKIRAFTTSSLL